ncbi:pseudouridine synthase [soil metagenome]
MAQKSRFRTTSGPTTNKAQKFKKSKPGERDQKSEGGSPFKKKSSFSDRKPPFKSFGEKGKPFVKRDFRDKDSSSPRSSGEEKGPREFSDRKPPFKSFSGKGKPFVKKEFKNKEGSGTRAYNSEKGPKDSSERRGDFSDRKTPFKSFGDKGKPFVKRDFKDKASSAPRSFDSEKEPKEFTDRKPKSFSRDDQKERGLRKDYSDNAKSTGKDSPRRNFDDRRDITARADKKSFISGKRPRTDRPYEESVLPGDDLIRLNRFISNSGICSRREADEMIKVGLISVNGQVVTELGFKVKRTDDVRHDGKRLKAEKPVYILLNKPKGFITTTDDPQERNTVMHLIAGACKERVYPVGRLDRNTSGLLLLTNDGDLTEKLSHPKHNVKKIYKAELDRPITKADFQKIVDGVRLEEGKAMVDDVAIMGEDGKTVGLEIHIGWNRVVRRIFEALGYEVAKLDRSVYATLDKKDLSRGHWRFLRQDEVIRLKHFQ